MVELRTRHPSTTVIAISGGGQGGAAEYLRVAKFLEAAKVLAKPFSSDALMTAVDELLAGGGTPASQPGVA